MLAFAALLPILAALILMTRFRMSPGRALPLAWGMTAAFALAVWKTGVREVAAASLSGICRALDIICIVFGAILLLNVLRETRLIEAIHRSFRTLSDDRRIQMIVIAWLFGGFIEGAAGFGAAPALAAPLLAGLGFPAAAAVGAALICNTLPVPFGAAGIPVMTSVATLTGSLAKCGMEPGAFSGEMLDALTMISGCSGVFIPFIAAVFVILSAGGQGKARAIAEILPFSLFAGAAYIVPWRWTALRLGPELPSILGAVVGLPAAVLALKLGFLVPKRVWRFPGDTETSVAESAAEPPGVPAWKAWIPYALLALILLLTRIPMLPLRGWMNALPKLPLPEFFGVPGTGFSWAVWSNPGIVPFAFLSVGTALATGVSRRDMLRIARETGRQIQSASLAIAAGVAMVQVMVFSARNGAGAPGMLDCIAEAAAGGLGRAYLFGAPFIGILGTFFSGSCTVSNILFAPLQFDTARLLHLSEPVIIALQNIGGGLGSMIRISGVVAACATVNAAGKEGKLILLNCIPVFLLAVLALIVTLVLY